MADLLHEKHAQFVLNLDSDKAKGTFEYHVTEHLRMSGAYWGCTAMALLQQLHRMDRDRLIAWIHSCYYPDVGGFGGNVGHDPHLLYTLSAIQLLILFNALDSLSTAQIDRIVAYIASLQQPDGSFAGDRWGEIDTRFVYCALNALTLLKRTDAINVDAALAFVHRCRNFDGGYGAHPGAESHAAQIFTCVGCYAVVDRVQDMPEPNVLAFWLSERQSAADGGLNGRPEKASDVCYSWWVLSSLAMLDHLDWIDASGVMSFIIRCQDPEDGGIADAPGDMADVFHTFFGLAGMSLLGDRTLAEIDPRWALPIETLKRHFGASYVPPTYKSLPHHSTKNTSHQA